MPLTTLIRANHSAELHKKESRLTISESALYFALFTLSVGNVRNKSNLSCSLDCYCKLSLMISAAAGNTSG